MAWIFESIPGDALSGVAKACLALAGPIRHWQGVVGVGRFVRRLSAELQPKQFGPVALAHLGLELPSGEERFGHPTQFLDIRASVNGPGMQLSRKLTGKGTGHA
jgi:hypothetical protein